MSQSGRGERGQRARSGQPQTPRGRGSSRGQRWQRGGGTLPRTGPPPPAPLEFIPSISRSSGLDKDGDSLKNHKVQEDYRAFIEEKLAKVLERRKNLDSEANADRQHRVEQQENILILFRKLREGISSSNRNDAFSLKVYERSLYLSIIFESPKHTTAIIPALLNDLYPKSSLSPHRHVTCLISLIHHLVAAYPSQSLYRQQQSSAPCSNLPEDIKRWLGSLTNSLRTGNYFRFNLLTQSERVLQLTKNGEELHEKLAVQALTTGVGALRMKARETMWKIVRSAYKELWLDEQWDTKGWLGRSLCLGIGTMSVDQWLEHANTLGQMRKKEGTEERWIMTRVR